MDWVREVVTSGVFCGLIGSTVFPTGMFYWARWVETRQVRKNISAQLADSVENLCEVFRNLEDTYGLSQVIDRETLQEIPAELGSWGNVRGGLILIVDRQLRKDLRDFFFRSAKFAQRVNFWLNHFDTTWSSNPIDSNDLAISHLNRAKEDFDRLIGLQAQGRDLVRRLKVG